MNQVDATPPQYPVAMAVIDTKQRTVRFEMQDATGVRPIPPLQRWLDANPGYTVAPDVVL